MKPGDELSFAFALQVAGTSGLLGSLLAGGRDASELGCEYGWNLEVMYRLLDVLAATGVVEWDGQFARLTEPWDAFIRRLPLGIEGFIGLWDGLAGRLMGSNAPLDTASGVSRYYRASAIPMKAIFERSAQQLAAVLADLPVSRRFVVDIGCGSGVWSEAVVNRSKNSRRVLLDLPSVVVRSPAGPNDLRVGGDARRLPLASGCATLTLLCNVLHALDHPSRTVVLAEAVRVTASDGHLVVIDAFSDDVMAPPDRLAIYALNLAVRGGDIVRPADLVSLLTEGGLVAERIRFGDPEAVLSALVLRRATV